MHTDEYFIYADLLGGNISFTPSEFSRVLEIPAGGRIDHIYEFNDLADASDMSNVYQTAYGLINAANLIIEHVEGNEVLSAEEISEIQAEALAFRAYQHFIIATYYAQNYSYTVDASHPGIVYNTGTIIAGIDFPARLTLAESYQLMKVDFESALQLFTGQQFLSYGSGNTYLNAMTTSSLFARVALQMNDWKSAYRYSDTVINYSGLSLTPDSMYVAEWQDSVFNLRETIYELSDRTDDDGNSSASVANEFYKYNNVDNYSAYVASGDLLDLYAPEDVRSEMFLEVLIPTSVNGILGDQPYFFTRKFQVGKGVPLTRLSEMYLIRAEAAARMETPDYVSALSDLNMIRIRAGLSPLLTEDNILEEIFLERRRELAFENHLFFDIARFHKDIERNQGCLSTVCNLAYPSDYYILPIPENNVLLNENLDQNHGY